MRHHGFVYTPHHRDAVDFASIAPSGVRRASVNWHKAISLVPVDALGNEDTPTRRGCGDCFWAAQLRLAQMRFANVMGSTWKPTADMAIAPYSAVTGYDPQTGANDNGTPLDEAQLYLAQIGLNLGLQAPDVLRPIAIDPQNIDHLQDACGRHGGIWIALNMPAEWDQCGLTSWPVAGPPSGTLHAVPTGRCEPSAGTFHVISWGVEIELPNEAIQKYAVAAGSGLSRNWFDTTGRSPSGDDYDTALAGMTSVA